MSGLSIEKQRELCPPISEWPEWANWFAIHENGDAYYFYNEPDAVNGVWLINNGRCEVYSILGFVIEWEKCKWSREEAEKLHLKSQSNGYKRKYIISKTDGSKVDPNADYFVLRLDKDPHALKALSAYAESVKDDNLELSNDLKIILCNYGFEESDNTIVMPRALTAEDGFKGALMGEFFEEIEMLDPETDEEFIQKIPVSWATIKSIYKRVVEIVESEVADE